MKNNVVIELKKVTKRYYLEKPKTVKGWFNNLFNPFERFTVIKDFSYKVRKGEFILVNGPNGAGKTTLLKLIAGITKPDEGEISVNGRVIPLIEFGSGFNAELTGRENIMINASIHGVERKRIKKIMPDIIKFSELEDFIDVRMKRYSTGMGTRLGFSIASYSEPDILLIDELFAVGDKKFKVKLIDRLETMRKKGTTVIITSNIETGLKIFDRKLVLERQSIQKS
jgi:ABC-2 type transport system ATP-binding protein